jgi:hypothetical protein
MNTFNDLKVGQAIKYNYLYSNEEEKIGLIVRLKKDLNFTMMIYMLADNEIDVVPYNIAKLEIL